MRGWSFRRFWQEGFEGERATWADWHRHLTTLFPEARLKRVLELRCTDAVPPDLLCSIPALWKGLLYDEAAREAAGALVSWSPQARDDLHLEVSKRGLAADTPDGPLLPRARELVAVAREGLRRLAAGSAASSGCGGETEEGAYLDPVDELLGRGKSPGQDVLDRWQGEWAGDPRRLIEHARY